MLTFSDIYEAMRKEKYSENLQMLPKNFMIEASEYFEEKKKISKLRRTICFPVWLLRIRKSWIMRFPVSGIC